MGISGIQGCPVLNAAFLATFRVGKSGPQLRSIRPIGGRVSSPARRIAAPLHSIDAAHRASCLPQRRLGIILILATMVVSKEVPLGRWILGVKTPIQFAAFALSLAFAYFGSKRFNRGARWVAPALFALAAIAVIGGLSLGVLPATTPAPSPQMKIGVIQQQTQSGSNTAGVQGNVTNDSQGREEPQKAPKQEKSK